MRNHALLLILCAIHLPGTCHPTQPPRDIKSFVANAQACEHAGGEYDDALPEDQKREIERNVRRYCGAASRQLPLLRKKYRHDGANLETIDRHATTAVTDYR